MALLWNRLNQSRLKLLFKTCYFQTPYASSLHFIPLNSKLHNPCGFNKTPLNIRFFASSPQANNVDGPRLNHQIDARFIRLVTDTGHRVVPTREALQQAMSLKLDLVEVQSNSDPPVCKIMDFHKEKYIQKVKEKNRAKSKSDVTLKKGEKEIRFSGKTEHKDLKMKADMVKKLMERGYRVRCVALGPKKRVLRKPSPKQVTDGESTEGSLADDLAALERKEQEEMEQELIRVLSQLTTLIEDVAVVESGPRVSKRLAFVLVKHVKFVAPKKGGAKKSDAQTTQAATKASGTLDDDEAESGDESEGQVSDDENDQPGEHHYTVRNPLSADSTNGTKTASMNFVKTDAELEVDRRNFNPSNLSHLRPAHDSKLADRVLPSIQKSSQELENRYRKVEPKPGFSQISRNSRPSDRRDSFSYDQRFSNERAQPQPGTNVSPSAGERRSTGNYAPAFRNTNLHPNEVRKPEVERPSPSYGIFSLQNKSSPSSNEGTGVNTNSPGSQVDNGQRKWGIFSRDSPHGASKPN